MIMKFRLADGMKEERKYHYYGRWRFWQILKEMRQENVGNGERANDRALGISNIVS